MGPWLISEPTPTPIAEWAAARFGHRIATVAGAVALTASLVGLAVAATHGYLAIAAAMVGMTLGLRVIMTVCAIALVNAMPANRTSIGAALNDTAQEIGTSLGLTWSAVDCMHGSCS